MTTHGTPSRPRQRLLIHSVLAAAILAIAWITYFLISFDLNDYRQQMEEQLASLLSLPVKIGTIQYNLNKTNLALHVANLEIANSDSTIHIKSPGTMINLKWRGLFERDFKFSKINMSQPQIWVRPDLKSNGGNAPPPGKLRLSEIEPEQLHKITVDDFEIVDGAIHIETSRSDQPTRQIVITAINGGMSDLRLSRTVELSLQGELRLPGQLRKSSWKLHGESALELDKDNGLRPQINLDLNLKDLNLNIIRELFAEQLPNSSIKGSADLDLHVDGAQDKNISFRTELSSEKIELLPSPDYANPIIFKKLLAEGQLQINGENPGINNFSMQIDKSHLAGHINWASHKKPFPATITLLNSRLSILQLKQWLPDKLEEWRTAQRGLGDRGAINIERAAFTLFEKQGAQKGWQIDQFHGDLQELVWKQPGKPVITITALPLKFSNMRWQINHGQSQWGSLPITINGAGEYGENGIIVTSLDLTGEAMPAKLLKEWGVPQHSLSTNGSIGLKGHLEGTLEKLNLDLIADLSQFSLNHPDRWMLTPKSEDKLSLHATLTPESFNLDHGAITWSVIEGHISGSYFAERPEDLTIDAFLKLNDLSKLARVLPFLETFQLSGQADLSISQKGQTESNHPEMTLTLRDAGLHATSHIADLSKINGRAQLTTTGLVAENLQVHLGDSPLVVQAQLEDFANPRLLLDVKASSIQADDLVFYSDQAILRNVDGHLEIDGDGLTFAPVDVSLDGGTKASVRGTISFQEPFEVQLDISSEFADISEIINLWTDRSRESRERSASTRDMANDTQPETPVTIRATVKDGDLYGMSFHDATGIITPTHDRLTIHPLDFSVGDGFCNAQVINDFSNDGPTLLRISGHAQDVDALEVYQELLNQKNIVRGKLRGDFYLTGEIGPNYLPSSFGNFSIQIHDGVLHQFPVLSKVFSLLNVSQIFALKLPDMDKEGMPFDLLSANFHLDKGILKSEDLEIESEAMNQTYSGQFDLIEQEIDLDLAIHPLGTVDKIVTRIPLAGWLLTGDDKALLTAYFSVEGKAGEASVIPLPLGTVTGPTFGLLKRALGLPFKLFEDPEILWGGGDQKE